MTKRLSIKVDEAEAEIKELRAQLDEMVLRMNDKNSGDDRRRLWQDRAEKTRAKLISKQNELRTLHKENQKVAWIALFVLIIVYAALLAFDLAPPPSKLFVWPEPKTQEELQQAAIMNNQAPANYYQAAGGQEDFVQ